MVLLKMLGFLDLSDSVMLRLGDKIRRSFRREIAGFLKQEFIRDLAIGTTQGNLSPARRSIYLPLLLTFLEQLLTSVLDPRPSNRLAAHTGQLHAGGAAWPAGAWRPPHVGCGQRYEGRCSHGNHNERHYAGQG